MTDAMEDVNEQKNACIALLLGSAAAPAAVAVAAAVSVSVAKNELQPTAGSLINITCCRKLPNKARATGRCCQ